jgi:hypothetical protein
MNDEQEIVLGAGMVIYLDRNGIRRFVLLDENDRGVCVYTEDLDPEWKELLLEALKT